MVTMSTASARRIAEVLNEKSDITDPEEPVTEISDGRVDFDHVSFTYKKGGSGEMALSDVDLHIRSGETIGILGGTGSSKSTLVNLISRLYDATEGTVRVGGRDVREYDLTALRNKVAVVLQKNQLFSARSLRTSAGGKRTPHWKNVLRHVNWHRRTNLSGVSRTDMRLTLNRAGRMYPADSGRDSVSQGLC
ncbi:MAG: ATP-binding cassette domain-containing protein [Mediterraneibacter sp.]